MKAENERLSIHQTLEHLAKYLKVVHGLELDLDERTCDVELDYYVCNLQDDVLFDAWKRYDEERSKGSRLFKQHFSNFRQNLRNQRETIRPFYAVAKTMELDALNRLRKEKVHVDWF